MISKSFVSAKLISMRKIHMMVWTTIPRPQKVDFMFLVDEEVYHIKDYKQTSTNNVYVFELELPFDYPFGKRTAINFTYFGATSIDVSDAVNFPEFDEKFAYFGDDLGAHYAKEETKFAVWAPIASEVILKIENENNGFDYHVLTRTDKGVYRTALKGDLLGKKYHYIVTNSGATRETNDPYEFSASPNSEYSCVVDINCVKNMETYLPERKINKYTDAFIYEVHVRDFTEQKDTDIVHKGKYLGMVEKGRKSIYGDPVSLDYLKLLGITHIQIQPILDFNSHDYYDASKEYNWGYDPISTMGIEGQYSTNPSDPMSRLVEFKTMVNELHKSNICTIVDVVYNHMFDYMKTAFEACVPNYFFRKRPNGTPAMASGCGNDFSSERAMGRKAVVDSVLHLVKTFDIDGLRYDLMGLMDIKTIKEVQTKVLEYKKDFIFYGEGWNMGLELKMEEKAAQENAFKLEGIGFFNDSYRDILKGQTFLDKIKVKGYINGDHSYTFGFIYSFLGSVTDFCFPKKYLSTEQSINYVECHDNNTLFDKLCESNANEDIDTLLRRIVLANELVTLSFGVPFIHMGQEFGQSKFGLDNTYNIPKVNNIDLKKMHERKDMIYALINAHKIREEYLPFLKELTKKEQIENLFEVETKDGLLYLKTNKVSDYCKYNEVIFIININNNVINYSMDKEYCLLFNDGVVLNCEKEIVKNHFISPTSLQILVRKQ